jgi:hypothetical protein
MLHRPVEITVDLGESLNYWRGSVLHPEAEQFLHLFNCGLSIENGQQGAF